MIFPDLLKTKLRCLFYAFAGIALFLNTGVSFAGNSRTLSADKIYFSFSGSAVFPEDISLETAGPSLISQATLLEAEVITRSGFGLNLAFGMDLQGPFRFEGEYAYKKTDVARVSSLAGETSIGGSLTSQAFLLNVLMDVQTSENFKLNFGAGAGIAVIDGTYDLDGHNSVPAGQVIVGMSYTPYNSYEFFTTYKYLTTSYFVLNGNSLDLSTHNLELGLRFYFDLPMIWDNPSSKVESIRNRKRRSR
ncbi:MAG: hypothetical protein COV66_05010 [Nitrospinae bacterium CG11_big_fil_rev_8_21_14_0_20_45_15]|nr:MAG: hypothetical protein COV66_05010 [Nitrospinae bacterium CG11_big_fil_rev_8_21_14_0_20_45_15]